jgi:hypothetical protein
MLVALTVIAAVVFVAACAHEIKKEYHASRSRAAFGTARARLGKSTIQWSERSL